MREVDLDTRRIEDASQIRALLTSLLDVEAVTQSVISAEAAHAPETAHEVDWFSLVPVASRLGLHDEPVSSGPSPVVRFHASTTAPLPMTGGNAPMLETAVRYSLETIVATGSQQGYIVHELNDLLPVAAAAEQGAAIADFLADFPGQLYPNTSADSGDYLPVVDPGACGCPACMAAAAAAAPVAVETAGDAVGATAATASKALTVGGSVTAFVNSAGDHDWYSITLTAGQTYILKEAAAGTSRVDTYLYLRNSAGTIVASNDDYGGSLNSQIQFTAETTGTYYVDAAAYGSTTGQYQLSVQTGSSTKPTYTVDQIAAYLKDGMGSHYTFATASHVITYNIEGLTAGAKTLAMMALQEWADIANITFSRTTGAAMMMIDDNVRGSAYASRSGNSSTINVGSDWYYGSTAMDSYTFQTYIHEIGHALGLGHAGPYNGTATYGTSNLYTNDSWAMTVMSYFSQSTAGQGSYRFVMTPMQADVIAIGATYGFNTTTRSGNTVYGFNSNAGAVYSFSSYTTAPSYTIYDTGGIDTIDASGYAQAQTINLNAETFSSIGGLTNNIAIARGTVIESAIGGSGNDTIIGNSAANRLSGGAGNDTISGGGGLDTMTGGAGSDTFVFNQALIAANRATITDFTHGTDSIQLASRVFTSARATAGVLNANEFRIGSAALTINDHIIYNSASGALSYDPDGSGAAAAVQFASLSTGLTTLTNTDFRVI